MVKFRCCILVFLLGLYASSASAETSSVRDVFLASERIPDKEFLYLEYTYPKCAARLTPDELQHDIAVLIAALEQVYSGQKYLPDGIYDRLLSQIATVPETLPLGSTESDGQLLCESLAALFWEVPDKHLYTQGDCRTRLPKPVRTHVGTNIYPQTGFYSTSRMLNGQRIGILSLGVFMPNTEDQSWEGFEEHIAKLCKESDALILDLRGNHGGMSDNIRWLADFLYGNPAKMTDVTIHIKLSSAVYAIDHNDFTLRMIKAAIRKQPIQNYLITKKQELLDASYAYEGQESWWEARLRPGSDAPFNPSTGYNKPIRILIDQQCASACEDGVARFLSHPHVKTYGVHTSGAVHYGDTGPLVLPSSHVIVAIPRSFREYADGRSIEKTGYRPDFLLEDGQDALEEALKEFVQIAP
jgi:hypothetical protein